MPCKALLCDITVQDSLSHGMGCMVVSCMVVSCMVLAAWRTGTAWTTTPQRMRACEIKTPVGCIAMPSPTFERVRWWAACLCRGWVQGQSHFKQLMQVPASMAQVQSAGSAWPAASQACRQVAVGSRGHVTPWGQSEGDRSQLM